MEAGTTGFKEARRELDRLLAPAERRALRRLAERTPAWINSDHLATAGLLAVLLWSAGSTIRRLYDEERLPPA